MSPKSCILVIGGGLLTLPLIERAREMGFATAVLDGNPEAPGMVVADHPLVVSTRDVPGAIEAARRLASGVRVDGVTTAGADVERSVAGVAQALDLPGPSPDAAYLCNHKAAMRRALFEAGIPGPDFAELKSPSEAAGAAAELGLPLMVKPMDNCGSRGVVRVDAREALEAAVSEALALSASGTALLEQFVEGSTHTVEMIGYGGSFELCSIIDTHHGFEPYAVELRHVNPSQLPAAAQREMLEIAQRAVRCVGLGDGPAKVDFLYSATGPQVMEMTARLSGGFHCQYTTPLALGTDNLRAAIDVSVGRTPRRQDIEPVAGARRVAICQSLFPPPGRLLAVSGLHSAEAVPGIEKIFPLAAPGDTLPRYRSSADRRFFLIAAADDLAGCESALEKAASRIEIRVEA